MFPASVFALDAPDSLINGQNVVGNYTSEDGSIAWNAAAATLTLQNAHLTDWCGFYFKNPNEDGNAEGLLTINLKGSNTIESATFGIVCNGDIQVIAEEGASLKINASSDEVLGERTTAFSGTNITVKGGTYQLSAKGASIYAYEDLNIEKADITAESSNEVALYSDAGNITVQDGSTLNLKALGQIHIHNDENGTDDYYSTSAIYAAAGNVTITGPDTFADLKASACAIYGTTGVHITDGATIIGESANAGAYSHTGNVTVDGGANVTFTSEESALWSGAESGTVTVSGQGTIANLTAKYCALRANGDVAISNGAKVTGISKEDTTVYTSAGNITIEGADTIADLTAYYCAIQSGQSGGGIAISDGAQVTGKSEADNAIYSPSGNVTISGGASLTVPSAKYDAIWAKAGNVTISGQNTFADLKVSTHAIYGTTGVHITDGATVVGKSEGVGAYSDTGNVTIDGGANVTFNTSGNSALWSNAESGNVTVSGQGTVANLTAKYCALQSSGDIVISDNAQVTGTSQEDSAVYTSAGNVKISGGASLTVPSAMMDAIWAKAGSVTVTGEKTSAELHSELCNIQTAGSMEISGGATVRGTSTADNAIYSPTGNITIEGAGTVADLTAHYCAIQTAGDVEFKNGADITGTSQTNSAIYSSDGNITISGGASLNVPSAKYDAIWAKTGNITVTGEKTRAELHADLSGIQADGNVEISGGAAVNASSGTASIRSENGNILLDGKDTRVECVSQNSYGIFALHGSITLNAGYVLANTVDGSGAMMARQFSDSSENLPKSGIVIGEGYAARDLIVATTVWKQNNSGKFYTETTLVPKETVLNAQGLLEDGYVPAKTVKITEAYILGDLNGDKKVDREDVNYLLQYTIYPDRYPLNQECDFTKDEKVDREDVNYLLQHTIYPDRYPLG